MNEILEPGQGPANKYEEIRADASLEILIGSGFGPIPAGDGEITPDGWNHGEFVLPPSAKVTIINSRNGVQIPEIVGAVEE